MLNRFQIRIDRLIEETALRRIELLAAPAELPALQHRHLVRQLIDLELLVLEFLALLGDLREERGGKITQLLCVHLCHIARQLHGSGSCHRRRRDDSRMCLNPIKY